MLNVINAQCVGSGYRVFGLDELASYMPSQYGVKADEIGLCINNLIEREYLSVKYLDQSEVCLCPLPKGRLVFENRIDSQIEKSVANKKGFLYGFLGALTGGLLGALVTLAILLMGVANA